MVEIDLIITLGGLGVFVIILIVVLAHPRANAAARRGFRRLSASTSADTSTLQPVAVDQPVPSSAYHHSGSSAHSRFGVSTRGYSFTQPLYSTGHG